MADDDPSSAAAAVAPIASVGESGGGRASKKAKKRKRKQKQSGRKKQRADSKEQPPSAPGGGAPPPAASDTTPDERRLRAFLRGLALQIPSASLGNLRSNDASLHLLLERALGALPMGSPLRKAAGEDFDRCVTVLGEEVGSRLEKEAEAKRAKKKEKRGKKEGGSAAGGKTLEIAAFDRGGYEASWRGVIDACGGSGGGAPDASTQAALVALRCSDHFAPDDLTWSLAVGATGSMKMSPRDALEMFRSRALSPSSGTVCVGGYAALFSEALDKSGDDVETKLGMLREFLQCVVAAGGLAGTIDGDEEDAERDEEAAEEVGGVLGCYTALALADPASFVGSLGDGAADDSDSDTASDDDTSDDEGGARPRPTPVDASAAVARAARDLTCLTSLLLCGETPSPLAAACILGAAAASGDILESDKSIPQKDRKRARAGAGVVFTAALIQSGMASRGALEAEKNADALGTVRRWVEGVLGRRRSDETADGDAAGGGRAKKGKKRRNKKKKKKKGSQAAGEARPLFVLDSAPDSAGGNVNPQPPAEGVGTGEKKKSRRRKVKSKPGKAPDGTDGQVTLPPVAPEGHTAEDEVAGGKNKKKRSKGKKAKAKTEEKAEGERNVTEPGKKKEQKGADDEEKGLNVDGGDREFVVGSPLFTLDTTDDDVDAAEDANDVDDDKEEEEEDGAPVFVLDTEPHPTDAREEEDAEDADENMEQEDDDGNDDDDDVIEIVESSSDSNGEDAEASTHPAAAGDLIEELEKAVSAPQGSLEFAPVDSESPGKLRTRSLRKKARRDNAAEASPSPRSTPTKKTRAAASTSSAESSTPSVGEFVELLEEADDGPKLLQSPPKNVRVSTPAPRKSAKKSRKSVAPSKAALEPVPEDAEVTAAAAADESLEAEVESTEAAAEGDEVQSTPRRATRSRSRGDSLCSTDALPPTPASAPSRRSTRAASAASDSESETSVVAATPKRRGAKSKTTPAQAPASTPRRRHTADQQIAEAGTPVRWSSRSSRKRADSNASSVASSGGARRSSRRTTLG